MRMIGVVTTARSDYGIYLPVLRRIEQNNALKLHLIVSGMHLSPDFGMTVELIEEDGFVIADRVESLAASDSPLDIAWSMGNATAAFGKSYSRIRPDILLVLGDRFEMFPAALAALPFGIPVAHIHGGELTQGAIDDALRHSMTKLSHLHFVSTSEYARRVKQLGEEPWRIVCCGAPGLDNLANARILKRAELSSRCGAALPDSFLLVTYHPVTLQHAKTSQHFGELLRALEACGMFVLFTMANADAGGRLINQMIQGFVAQNETAVAVDNLGTEAYFSAMQYASAMVGNSSSGIVEAASFELPVVNIGIRQDGRVRAHNVIDVEPTAQEIIDGIKKACSPAFVSSLKGMENPYGSGTASQMIVDTLQTVSIDERLLTKRFYDCSGHVSDGNKP